VPHRLIREQLDVRVTAHTIELFRKGERVAVHLRSRDRDAGARGEPPPPASTFGSSSRRGAQKAQRGASSPG
jgi:hypothetical protein